MQFNEYNNYTPVYVVQRRRKYGIFRFLIDALMTTLTSGIWLIWIFVREMRRR
jgi:hypothetical protein